MAEEDKWLPRMTRAFMELDSSTHAIDTAQFAAAMEQVHWCKRAAAGCWLPRAEVTALLVALRLIHLPSCPTPAGAAHL